jgi:hypothetical protein
MDAAFLQRCLVKVNSVVEDPLGISVDESALDRVCFLVEPDASEASIKDVARALPARWPAAGYRKPVDKLDVDEANAIGLTVDAQLSAHTSFGMHAALAAVLLTGIGTVTFERMRWSVEGCGDDLQGLTHLCADGAFDVGGDTTLALYARRLVGDLDGSTQC